MCALTLYGHIMGQREKGEDIIRERRKRIETGSQLFYSNGCKYIYKCGGAHL